MFYINQWTCSIDYLDLLFIVLQVHISGRWWVSVEIYQTI